jgi:hypothetical protein
MVIWRFMLKHGEGRNTAPEAGRIPPWRGKSPDTRKGPVFSGKLLKKAFQIIVLCTMVSNPITSYAEII